MPIIIAIAVRYIIMAAIQLGIWSIVEKYGIALLNKAIIATMEFFGVPEETAKDIMANEIIKGAESVLVFAGTLKTKLPVKVAELLGFTAKGFVKRKLATSVEAKVIKAVANTGTTATAGAGVAAETATVVAATRGFSLASFKTFLGIVATLIGVPTGFFFALAQYIDFANWQGPYQKTFQNLLTYIGINPDSPMPKASVVSADIWKRIYSTIEEFDPIGISFPFSGVDKVYSRANLADLVDEVAANLVLAGGTASYKNVIGAVIPLVQLSGKANNGKSGSTLATLASGATSTTQIKVFTGVVTQGTLGATVAFQARENDLINDTAELKDAAQNNLASFVATLPGKLSYEIKIQNSVITKDGTRRTGTAQQVRSGTSATGAPKYKTVLNKFAVLDVFVFTDKNVRTKITQIILGPTDSVTLQPKVNELQDLASSLPKSVFTTDINEISGVQTSKPITVAPPPAQLPATVPTATATPTTQVPMRVLDDSYFIMRDGTPFPIWRELKDKVLVLGDPRDILTEKETEGLVGYGNFLEKGRLKLLSLGIDTNTIKREPFPIDRYSKFGPVKQVGLDEMFGAAPTPAPAPAAPAKVAVAEITTLSQWYASRGEALPSVLARGQFYENLGLGLAGYYTGTAEQNTKLLNALKTRNLA